MFAHEKVPGLPRDRLIDAIEPVLRAHGLRGVELVWRTDAGGRVLYMTLESADAAEPGQGVTLDVCARVSRDLSTAFDVLGLIDGNYRLEVGSPGLERRLYTREDYQRFAGKLAKLKLGAPVAGQSVISGKLAGVDAEGRVLLEHDDAPRAEPNGTPVEAHSFKSSNDPSSEEVGMAARAIAFEQIRSGQLVVDWQQLGFSPLPRQRAGRRSMTSRPKRAGAAQGRK
jgi:ribosome maturation factor RimP